MRFIHIADVHIGMEPDKGKPWSKLRAAEIVETLTEVVARCVSTETDLLLIAGDLFHKQPLLKELKELNYIFSKLGKTRVVIIAGNHDYMGLHSPYRTFEWCNNVIFLKPYGERSAEGTHNTSNRGELFEPYVLEIGGTAVHIYGFSYEKRDITEARYDEIYPEDSNAVNILLAHGGDRMNVPIDRRQLEGAGFDYVALGHLHKPERISHNMAYAGSLEPLDKTETGDHGYFTGVIYKGEKNIQEHHKFQKILLEFVPFSQRKYIDICIEADSELTNQELYEKALNAMRRMGEKNIYKINLIGYYEPGEPYDTEYLKRLGNVVEIKDLTVPDYDFEHLKAENQENLIGMFIKAVEAKELPEELAAKALYYGIEALMKAGE